MQRRFQFGPVWAKNRLGWAVWPKSPSPLLCSGRLLLILGLLIGTFRAGSTVYAGAILVDGNKTITDAGLNGAAIETPDLVIRGNERYVVWADKRDEDTLGFYQTIYFAKSTDGGQSWGANVRVSASDYDDWSDHPQIAVAADGIIWVAWYLFYQPDSNQTNEIRLAKSVDGGATFTVTTLVDGFPAAEDRWLPQIAVDEPTGNLLLLYNEYWENGSSIGYDLYLRVYSPQLQLLSQTTINDQPRTGKLGEGSQDNAVPKKSLVAKGGLICAAWEDQRQRFMIHGACSTNGGQSFGANFPVSVADGLGPQLAVGANGQLYVTYYLATDSRQDIYLRASTDQGSSWSEPRNVTQLTTPDEVRAWAFQVDDNGQLLIAWIKRLSSSVSTLLLATSLDQGQHWAELPLADGTGQFPTVASQFDVALAVAGSGVESVASAIWNDDRNVQEALYSQALALDSIPPTAPPNLAALGSDRSNLLTWDAATDATGIQGYRVYRSSAAAGPYTEITARLVTATSYRDVELGATPYFYRVAAVDGTANTGPLTEAVSATALNNSNLPTTGTIAYAVNNEIRLRDFANFGVERVFAAGQRPRMSADGGQVYYQANDQIFSKPLGGGNSRVVYSATGLAADYDIARFDPVNNANNEGYIAAIISRNFVSTVVGGLCFVSEPHYRVNGQQRFVDEYNYSAEIALSAEPQWLLYRYRGFCNVAAIGTTTPGDLYVVNLATNETIELRGVDLRDPDFAPVRNDNRVVFAAPFSGQYEIWHAELDGTGQLRNYTQLTRGATGVIARSPTWSTDGNWVIFQRDVDPGQLEDQKLFIVRADGSSLRALNISGLQPAWAGGGAAVNPGELTERFYLPLVTR